MDRTIPHRYFTSTMQWSECNTTTTTSMNDDTTNGGGVGGVSMSNVGVSMGGAHNSVMGGGTTTTTTTTGGVVVALQNHPPPIQQQQQPLSTMTTITGASAPTIKNHSVTHFGRYLYCFGGYDGRRNHTTLLLYDLLYHRWIRPIHYDDNSHTGVTTTTAAATTTTTTTSATNGNDSSSSHHMVGENLHHNDNDDDFLQHRSSHHHHQSQNRMLNDTGSNTTSVSSNIHNNCIIVRGTPPPGRNGHSATLAAEDEENGRIVIIGGWLGTGPLAASDTHILDVSCGGQVLRWYQPTIHGTPPGPCNMHSADYVAHSGEVYVFRGGNGREYLNDLHALNVKTLTWREVATTGEIPQQRANHSSAVLDETCELFIFGGWNGTERLNDIHILDTITSTWTFPKIHGILPHPRAGMTLTALRGRLYLFGGSGTSAKCFQDLQILDRQEMAWLDVSQCNDSDGNSAGVSMLNRHHHHHHHHEPQFLYGGSNYHNSRSGTQDGNSPVMFGFSDETLEPQQAGGTQEGGNNHHHHNTTFPLLDWRSRDMLNARSAVTMRSHHHSRILEHASPNPNDEDTVPTVLVHGHGPGRRAGHTATAVNRHIYIFGGSCGSDYLNDFFVLDTDPPLQTFVTEPTSLQLFERRLRHFFNDEEFADVTFIVQGQKVFGHKMVLSIVSECFRAMFTTGFRESEEMEIEIPDCSYAAFVAVMEYIYTGSLPNGLLDIAHNNTNNQNITDHPHLYRDRNLVRVVEILELADRFFLDHLKQICESKLQHAVNGETVEYLLPVAQKTNASQLLSICEHLLRNRETIPVSTISALRR
jgi:leucine-zipper-like transcriptional regulator 1